MHFCLYIQTDLAMLDCAGNLYFLSFLFVQSSRVITELPRVCQSLPVPEKGLHGA